jgi:isopenicillin N synthase-like dioxygenase
VDALPVIDLTPLRAGTDAAAVADVAAEVDAACREIGFFCVTGHGVPAELVERLEAVSRQFFSLPEEEKARIGMARGGRAWRGWFPVGAELTSGVPDVKEGLYLGQELGPDDPRVRAGVPLHGPNLFPERPPDLGEVVLAYVDAVTAAGQLVLRAMAQGMGLEPSWFVEHLTADPTVLFRVFHYPPVPAGERAWSVGEHTDYGLVTLLLQDDVGGLEVHGPQGWVAVPPRPDALVVNLGDMLERMTGGRYRSTAHRVRNVSDRDRLSFPLFLDPGWDVEVQPVPAVARRRGPVVDQPSGRWDGEDPLAWTGTYGQYLLSRVGRVFPQLRDEVLADPV